MIKVSVLIGEPLDPASELCDNVLVLAQKSIKYSKSLNSEEKYPKLHYVNLQYPNP